MSAFRILPLKRNCYRLLILKANHPVTGELSYFVEKNLPFGHSISCSHFQHFSNCLKHILEYINGAQGATVNYLDDFLFLHPTAQGCNTLVRLFLNLCEKIGVPVAMEKTVWASNVITFLGMELNRVDMKMTILEEKRRKALNRLLMFEDKKKATVNQLEKLTGLLNFLNKAIVPGRAFTRQMYAKINKTIEKRNLRKHHHITIDQEFRQDCTMWRTFLTSPKELLLGKLSRPFIDLYEPSKTAEMLFFYSDATANPELGFGVIFDSEWLFQQWDKEFILNINPSIEFLELYALCVGIFTWSHKLENRRFTIFCDNTATRDIVNQYSSGCKYSMILIRKLVLKSLECNFRINVVYMSSRDNFLSDNLSRLNISKFKNLAKKHGVRNEPFPTQPSTDLWPLTSFWNESCAGIK